MLNTFLLRDALVYFTFKGNPLKNNSLFQLIHQSYFVFRQTNGKTSTRSILLVRMALGKILLWLRFPVNPIWLRAKGGLRPPFNYLNWRVGVRTTSKARILAIVTTKCEKNINSFENVQFFSFLFKNLRLFRKLSNPSFCLMHWRIFTLKVVNCECIAEKDNDTLHSTLCDLDPRGEFSGPINRFLRMVSLFKPLLLDGRFIVADLRWILLIYFLKKCYD